MLLKGENKQALELYLNTVNQKNDFENTIWYGIIPSINLDEVDNAKNIRQRFKGTTKVQKKSVNTNENLQVLMSILAKYKVASFFSVIGSDETTFNNLATTGIGKYVEKTKNLQYRDFSQFLIPCVPNFTIIPKEKSSVILDYKLKTEESNPASIEAEKNYGKG